MNISAIIPSYKNKEQLIRNLRNNLPYLQDCEVIVVNDYPRESLKTDLQDFSQVKLIENEQNLGFGEAVNRGVNHSTQKYIMLLNSDVVLNDRSYQNAVKHFEGNQQLFAVSFAQKEKDGTIVGKNKIYWKNGFFNHSKADDLTLGKNAWAEGGSCLIDKEKYLKLKGFDNLYLPFYWEDIDLSYRAWKSGYEVLFDPSVQVEHHHESTIGKYFSSATVKSIAYRNQFLFIWKNISDKKLRTEHLSSLPKHVLYYLIKGDWAFIFGLIQAAGRLPISQLNAPDKRSDYEILHLFQT